MKTRQLKFPRHTLNWKFGNKKLSSTKVWSGPEPFADRSSLDLPPVPPQYVTTPGEREHTESEQLLGAKFLPTSLRLPRSNSDQNRGQVWLSRLFFPFEVSISSRPVAAQRFRQGLEYCPVPETSFPV